MEDCLLKCVARAPAIEGEDQLFGGGFAYFVVVGRINVLRADFRVKIEGELVYCSYLAR